MSKRGRDRCFGISHPHITICCNNSYFCNDSSVAEEGGMDGWMDGWMNERMNGRMNGRMDGWIWVDVLIWMS